MQHPGFALNKLLFACLLLWLSYRWASLPGWEPAWLFVAVFALAVWKGVLGLIHSHRVWVERRRLSGVLPPPEEDPHGRRDLWRQHGEPQRDQWPQ